VRSPQDRRAFLIHLTAGGRRAQRSAASALAGAADTLLTPLDNAERRHLVDLLATVADRWQQVSASQKDPSASQARPAAPTSKPPPGRRAAVSRPARQRAGRGDTSRSATHATASSSWPPAGSR
jgi:hypothetical protein